MALINVPNPGQTLDSSRPDINANFANINTQFAIDHVEWNITGAGKHNKVSFPVQAVTPTFSANEEGLYNKALAGVSELYVHKQSFAGVKEIPFTASTLSTSTPASGVGGWTWVASGMIFLTGSGNANGLTTVTINPVMPNQILTVVVGTFASGTTYINGNVRLVDIISPSQFRVFGALNGAAGTIGFSFIVMGY